MCAPPLILGAMAVAGGMQAYGQYQEGSSSNKYYQYLAGQSRLQGEAAVTRAQRQAEVVQDSAKLEGKEQAVKTAQTAGAQRAAMAAMGLDPTSVTGQDVTLDSYSKAKLDEAMIRRNADLQTWSLTEEGKFSKWAADQQADQYSVAGKQAKRAGKIGAFTTILATAASMGFGAHQMGMLGGKAATTTTGGGGLLGSMGSPRTGSFLVR